MRITEAEHLALVMMSNATRAVTTTYGSVNVRLIDTPENQWAIEEVRKMRSELPGQLGMMFE